jgi:predicted component of type VI protein secretion system
VFINGSDTPASLEGAYRLQDGDRLRLGDYEVLVSIDERNDFAADDSGQIPAPPRVRNKSNVKTHHRATDGDLGEELDLTDLLSDSAIAPAPAMPPPLRAPSSSSSPLDLESALALDSDDLKAMGPIPAAPAPVKAPKTAFASLLGESGEHKTVARPRKPKLRPRWKSSARPTTGTCRRGRTIAKRCRRLRRPPRWQSRRRGRPSRSVRPSASRPAARTAGLAGRVLSGRGHRPCEPAHRPAECVADARGPDAARDVLG